MITIRGDSLPLHKAHGHRDGTWYPHSYVRHSMYESMHQYLSGLEYPHAEYKLLEFGTREANTAVMSMMAEIIGPTRTFLTASEFPEVDIQKTWFGDNYWDITVADQVLEHVERPWVASEELHRITKPGGLCIVATPFMFPVHRTPVDCWRIGPDGYKVLFSDSHWDTLLYQEWGNLDVFKWESQNPVARCFAGDWINTFYHSTVPGASEPADSHVVMMWWIGKKRA